LIDNHVADYSFNIGRCVIAFVNMLA